MIFQKQDCENHGCPSTRTFATVLANMERYPSYIFGASQPQQLQWIKDQHPEMFQKIQARVAEGRWECQGCMWVEPDTNITGGESLIRQTMHGQKFWAQNFNKKPNHLWEPDVFGYTASLPQILRKSGVPYMMTQKLSWNAVNFFPHHAFHWQGIDGTRCLVHTLPEETYNSPAAPRAVKKIEQNYREAGVSEHALMVYGIGDGGGGPGTEHLERLQRIANLAGLCPVQQETAEAFFSKWSSQSANFPTWVGELYLEKHQGTFTTNAKTKRGNRRMEHGLRELEFTAVINLVLGTGCGWPAAQLDQLWQETMLYQFHDILPGSSIKRVYDECEVRYDEMLTSLEVLIATQQQAAVGAMQISSRKGANAGGEAADDASSSTVLFNSLSWSRREWVQHGETWIQATVPPLSATVAAQSVGGKVLNEVVAALSADSNCVENDLLRVRFDQDGSVASVYDKENGREVLDGSSRANRLAVYHDTGDAWDFPMDYADQKPRYMQLISSESAVRGPYCERKSQYKLGQHTRLSQTVRLTAGSRRIDFITHAHWRETKAMLRTSFPVAVLSPVATYEIQFGSIERPTHRNTTWDLAKDECPAHKWADLSQRDYGVALLNDCKYGYKIRSNVVDLNLIRSVPYPRAPLEPTDDLRVDGDPAYGFTDQDDHSFTYALYPHAGDHVAGGVVRQGYELNIPLRAVRAGSDVVNAADAAGVSASSSCLPLLTISAAGGPCHIVCDTVKAAEDGSGRLVFRLYESAGASENAQIEFGMNVSEVREVNLMEEQLPAGPLVLTSPSSASQASAVLRFLPYEIKTLLVSMQAVPANRANANSSKRRKTATVGSD